MCNIQLTRALRLREDVLRLKEDVLRLREDVLRLREAVRVLQNHFVKIILFGPFP